MLFVAKDKVVKVEHTRAKSKVFMWRLGKKSDGEWRWNFEHEEKMQHVRHQLSRGQYIVINGNPNHDLELY